MTNRIYSDWSPRNPDGSIRWSWSVISRYFQCPRLYELSVVRNLVSASYGGARELGIAFHRGMAVACLKLKEAQEKSGQAYWDLDQDWQHYLADTAEATINAYPNVNMEDRETAIRLARAYILGDTRGESGPQHLAQWRIIQIEETLDTNLNGALSPELRREPIPWSQTADLIVQIGGNAAPHTHGIWVADWKTQAALRSFSLRKYKTDGQALACTALASIFMKCRGFRPIIVTKTKEIGVFTDGIEYSQAEINEFIVTMRYWQRTINQFVKLGITDWPKNYGGCVTQYGYCDFYAACHEGAIDDYVERGTESKALAAADVSLADLDF